MSEPHGPASRLVVLAFDGAEISLVERGMAAGWLPNLRQLRDRGVMVPLLSTSNLLVGSVWPSFYSGLLPPEHGSFGVVQWRPETMRHERVDGDSWLPTTPFYRKFGADGPRVLAIDMPFAPTPQPFAGVELVAWNAHATRARCSGWPTDLPERVRRRHGAPVMREEIYGPQRPRSLLRLRDELVAAARQQARLVTELMRTERWDLLLAAVGAGHRAGHKLFPTVGTRERGTDAERTAIETALEQVYVACDAAIGEIVAAAGHEATVAVFTPNGMVANTSHYFLLPEMLRRILDDDHSDRSAELPPRPGIAEALRQAVPIEYRSWLKERLPIALKDALGRRWRHAERRNWSKVRAFRLIGSDLEGQVQINLRGRERDGIVASGAEYEDLCREIADGLLSFMDADTGEAIVAEVLPTAALWPEVTARRHLPDLVIRWAKRSPQGLRALRSARHGGFANPYAAAPPDGRSGHHQPMGWAMAAGPGILPGPVGSIRPVFDLTATVFAHFGLAQPDGMRGKPIEVFLAGSARHV